MNEFLKIERKWQKAWEAKKIFEANLDKRKKFFLTFPYPYINLSPHMGHFYTIMRVEAFARYKRLKGYNVLFPQGWHATGSPIVSSAERIKEREPKQIELLKKEGFSEEEIKKFVDPEHWIKVFREKWIKDLKDMGLSIDWRRNFITTSLNPYYDKFIKWQFGKLKDKGLVVKGKHAVVWDPKTNMPVGDHDRIKGEGEVPQEFCLFKFRLPDARYLITATLRPDTVLGITNVYVNPNVDYIEIEVNNERWIIGEPAIDKLKNQDYFIRVVKKISGLDLIGKKVESFGNKKIPVLPATFLDPNYGTGMVHSVPSDSADDLIALQDLQKNDDIIKKYKLNPTEVKAIKPIEIFVTPEIGGNSAQYFLDKYNIKSQNEREKLEKIKTELYKLTFSKSKLNFLYKNGFSKDLSEMPVIKAQSIIKEELLKKGQINLFYELTGEVISRSLTKCIIKIVSDQWFIKYGDKGWKKKVHKLLNNIKLYPEIVREQFEYVIDWINDWACTREYGLGTRLPFDEKWLIESLSDSTIYMAYYTISHMIKDIPISKVNDELFDYIFLNKGDKPKIKNIDKIKREFEYWYPLDFRNSGKDLVQNHLTFFLFNHVAIFPQKYFPKGIGVNGWVRVDGQKMSKSLGNITPLKEMNERYGADASRLTILNGGEALDDPNWDSNFAQVTVDKLKQLYDFCIQNYNIGRNDRKEIDNWMDTELSKIIKETEAFMEQTLFRSAIQKAYFDLQSKLKWYIRRTHKLNKSVINNVIETQLILLSPFCPHICEEIWNKIGKKGFVSLAEWPKVKEVSFKGDEDYIKKIREDINSVLRLIKFKPKKIYLYTIPSEKKIIEEAKEFYEKEFNVKIEIWKTNDLKKKDPMNKSMRAKAQKPAIYVE